MVDAGQGRMDTSSARVERPQGGAGCGLIFQASASMASTLWLDPRWERTPWCLHYIYLWGLLWEAHEKMQVKVFRKTTHCSLIVAWLWVSVRVSRALSRMLGSWFNWGEPLSVWAPVHNVSNFSLLKKVRLWFGTRTFFSWLFGCFLFLVGGKCYQNILFGTRKCRGNGKQKWI